jgi:DNA-binding CsgD family transcriptional regulator
MVGGIGILLERDAERRQLGAALTEAAAGRGRLVLVEGEAGIGKSAILQEAVRQAQERSVRVLAARGSELEQGFAYGVARQLFEGELARASPARRARMLAGAAGLAAPIVLETDGSAALERGVADVFAAQHGLYWLAANVASDRPLALLIDDVQWADPPSVAWLGYLARRLEGVALLLVVTLRTGETEGARDLLTALCAAAGERLRPRPLGEESVRALIGSQLRQAADVEFTRACRALTGGNPFLISELALELAAEGIEPSPSGVERLGLLVPGGVQQSVLLRLSRLGDDAAALARAACVLGECDLRHAAALARLDVGRAAAAADGLAGAAIFDTGLPLRFRHPLLRAAVERDIGTVRVAADRHRAARLLVGWGAAPERVAAYLLQSQPAGESWAVEALRDAATGAVARGAPEVAANCLRRALIEDPAAPTRAEVLRELGRAEALAFSPLAIEHLNEALVLATEDGERARLARELALALWRAARPGEADQVLMAALQRGVESTEARLWLEAERAAIAMFSLDFDWQILDAGLERSAFGSATSSPAERAVRLAYGARLAQRGAPAARVLEVIDIDGVCTEVERLPPGSAVQAAVGFALLSAAPPQAARAVFERDLEQARLAGVRFDAGQAINMLAMTRLREGNLPAAHAAADEALGIAREGRIAIGVLASLGNLLVVLAGRGLTGLAWEEAQRDGLAGDRVPELMASARLLEGRGLVHLAAGDARRALADLRRGGEMYRRWGVSGPGFTNWRSHAAEALVALGERAEAARMAAEDVELAERAAVPRALGIALRALALTQTPARQLDTLERAADVLAGSEDRLGRAHALCDFGAALRRQGRRYDARAPLSEAMEVAERSGARPLSERCRAELRLSGARPRSLMRSGVDALTPAELRVCELAAAGRSNPEIAQALFVTRATVASQLHSAYRKLDVNGREDLAATLARGPTSAIQPGSGQ